MPQRPGSRVNARVRRRESALFIGFLAVLAVSMVAPGQADARDLPRQVAVIDGDGFELGGVVIRLWGIDAPEMGQECEREGRSYPFCGLSSKMALESLLNASEGLSCKILFKTVRALCGTLSGRETDSGRRHGGERLGG